MSSSLQKSTWRSTVLWAIPTWGTSASPDCRIHIYHSIGKSPEVYTLKKIACKFWDDSYEVLLLRSNDCLNVGIFEAKVPVPDFKRELCLPNALIGRRQLDHNLRNVAHCRFFCIFFTFVFSLLLYALGECIILSGCIPYVSIAVQLMYPCICVFIIEKKRRKILYYWRARFYRRLPKQVEDISAMIFFEWQTVDFKTAYKLYTPSFLLYAPIAYHKPYLRVRAVLLHSSNICPASVGFLQR